MLERIIVWTLVKSGHRQMGNYLLIDGKYVHKRRVVWDFMGGCLVGIAAVGAGCVFWIACKCII